MNVSSINGMRGKFGQANYAASKAGIIGLTKSAACDLGPSNVNVNAVALGLVETDMTLTLPEKSAGRRFQRVCWGGSPGRRTSPMSSSSSLPLRRGTLPAKSCASTAASISDGGWHD